MDDSGDDKILEDSQDYHEFRVPALLAQISSEDMFDEKDDEILLNISSQVFNPSNMHNPEKATSESTHSTAYPGTLTSGNTKRQKTFPPQFAAPIVTENECYKLPPFCLNEIRLWDVTTDTSVKKLEDTSKKDILPNTSARTTNYFPIAKVVTKLTSSTKSTKKEVIIFVEGSDEDYVADFNAKMISRNLTARMETHLSNRVTHYVVDYPGRNFLVKSANYYVSIGRNLFILMHSFLKEILQTKKFPDEFEHEARYRPQVMEGPRGYRYERMKMLRGHYFIFVEEFNFANFRISREQMKLILKENGGTVVELNMARLKQDMANDFVSSEITDNARKTYIVATNIGTKKAFCNEYFKFYGWLTVSAEFFLCVIERQAFNKIEEEYIFTTKNYRL